MDHTSASDTPNSGNKSPEVPIKTYKWEDVRRSRKRGGYPWTYLTKDPFNEEDDYDLIMNGLRKNKNSSSLSGTESVDIKEITEEDIKELENIDSSYVVIESPILFDATPEQTSKNNDQTAIESAESSDNISQYLDKEETTDTFRQIESTETLTIPGNFTPDIPETSKIERAKSEEPKRKRKLSLESNHSNISLPKFGLKKKFEEAKKKIKSNIPKKILKSESVKESVGDKKPPLPKSKTIKQNVQINEKPVYIHIPLRPPEGETDEFSYLEFEEKRPVPQPEIKIEETHDDEEIQVTTPTEENKNNNKNMLSLKIEDDQDDVSAIIFLEGEEGDKENFDIMVIDMDENGTSEMTIEEVTNLNLRQQVLDSIKKVESIGDITNKTSSNSPSSSEKKIFKKGESLSELSRKNSGKVSRSSSKASDKTFKRAKSEEPARKRRNSIESKTSRKSLPKLNFLKRIKSLHFPFSSLKKSQSVKSIKSIEVKTEEPKPIAKESTKLGSNIKPVYIHIPLKPPPGETDEFSHLEFETPIKKIEKPEPPPESPKENVEEPLSPLDPHPQFIFLTPPSDDEILDKPDVPETPSSECESLFGNRIGELKELAKSAVDEVEGKRLSTVEEENPPQTVIEISELNKEIEINDEIVIDEEDGLKSSKVADDQKLLKSSFKGEASPILKKKVSFKRRNTKDSTISDDYEYISTPLDEKKVDHEMEKLSDEKDMTLSMSATEEKAYLDEKLTSTTSLQEDYKNWSKISDHEYEPVNPPPEVPPLRDQSPKIKTLEPPLDRSLRQQYSDEDTQNDVSIQEMQSDLEYKYFNKAINETPENSPRTSAEKTSSPPKENEESRTSAIQSSIRESANKIKTKLQNIKKPNISLPTRPKFSKTKFNFPKMPNAKNIHLPNFSLTRAKNQPKTTKVKTTIKQRQYSTESNAGDSSKTNIFDFRTYPRFLRKKNKPSDNTSLGNYEIEKESPKKTKKSKIHTEKDLWGDRTSIRIPLHSEESMDKDHGLELSKESEESPHRYNHHIDVEDQYEKENRSINKLIDEKNLLKEDYQKHELTHQPTSFDEDAGKMVTDLDEPYLPQNVSFDTNQSKDGNSSVSSFGQHRRGVIEEIDSDQFFLREKGISQDNIDMGMYLTSEIREAFRAPPRQDNQVFMSYEAELHGSNRSLPETKRKPTKKPKRKKTPHASNEKISNSSREQLESEEDTMKYNYMPPSRPKRRSKKQKKRPVIPYQETISYLASEEKLGPSQEDFESERYQNNDSIFMPNIELYNPDLEEHNGNFEYIDDEIVEKHVNPEAPPRKNKSLRSLNISSDRGSSILGQFDFVDDYHRYNNNILGYQLDQRERSSSPGLIEDTVDFEIIKKQEFLPKRPDRKRSRTRSRSRATSHPEISEELEISILTHEDQNNRQPVIEEPCIKDLRDSMGYAIVDKNGHQRSWDHKFCSVPRKPKEPNKPTRNYHTIGPTRPPRKKNLTDEEKEHIDITQYIEIDEDKHLQSGEVIQKIQNRPLPAPPRPPRKTRTLEDEDNSDADSIKAIEKDDRVNNLDVNEDIVETEVSTQTDPLPDGFVCEEVPTEESDKIITPSVARKNEINKNSDEIQLPKLITPTKFSYDEEIITHGQLIVEPLNGAKILSDSTLQSVPKERIIPLDHDMSESDIPESFHKLSNPPNLNDNNEKDNKCPKLDPQIPNIELLRTQKLQISDLDIDRLTVNELVANKIVVSEIESGNIVTSSISSQSGTLNLGEIGLESSVIKKILEKLQTSNDSTQNQNRDQENQNDEQKKTSIKSTPFLKTVEFNKSCEEDSENYSIPLENIQDDFFDIKDKATEYVDHIVQIAEEYVNEINEQVLDSEPPPLDYIFTPNSEPIENEVMPPVAPKRRSKGNIDTINTTDSTKEKNAVSEAEAPMRPLRDKEKNEFEQVQLITNETQTMFVEDDIDNELPPRPPAPPVGYIPSQPPPSFYALRAQQFVDVSSDIPAIARKKRHYRRTISRSSSSESIEAPMSRRRYRTPEPSIPQLTSQLARACASVTKNAIKRLIDQINASIPKNNNNNEGAKQDIQVIMVILLVLIAGLLLLGYGDSKTIHLHHWEYFNPPGKL